MIDERHTGRAVRRIWALLGIAVAVVWAIFRSGTDTVYQLQTDAVRAADWPNPGLRVEEAYTRMSAIGPWLYKLVGGDSDVKYLVLSAGTAVVSVLLLCMWCLVNAPREQGSRALRLVILAPVVAILATQIGNYDPFTVLGIGLFLFAWSSGRRSLLGASGFYLGLQHFEQGFLGILLFGIFVHFAQNWLPSRLRGSSSPLWALLGVVIGKVALSFILFINGVSISDERAAWISDPELLRFAIVGSVNFLPALLMSLFAGAWAIVLASGVSGMNRSAQVSGCVIIVIGAIFAVVTLDHTRVFVLITLPLLMLLMVGLLNRWPNEVSTRILVLVEFMAWLIIPVSLYTSPDGPTFLKDLNVTDHFLMLSHFALSLT